METPNLSYIKELSEGDISFENNIITILKKEFPEESLLFHKNLNNSDFIAAASNVHKIKHKISLLGLKNGLKVASKFEIELKNGDMKLYQDFTNILNKISIYLDSK